MLLDPTAAPVLQKTPLRMSGVYVKSVVPDSPAALSQKLRTGDHILAVNGISLVGMDYNRWVGAGRGGAKVSSC